jgi:hypothetical protein
MRILFRRSVVDERPSWSSVVFVKPSEANVDIAVYGPDLFIEKQLSVGVYSLRRKTEADHQNQTEEELETEVFWWDTAYGRAVRQFWHDEKP